MPVKIRQDLNLTPSLCQLQIRNLRDGYQDLAKKVIEVQEDGKSYFHQEFEEKAFPTGNSDSLGRPDATDMKRAILNQPEEEQGTKEDYITKSYSPKDSAD